MNKLKVLRKKKGVTQKTVAEYLGVAPTTYTQYETEKRGMSIDILTKLSEYFGVTTDEILGINTPAPEPFGRPIVMKPELEPEDEVMIPLVASLRCGYDAAGEPFSVIRKIPIPKSYVAKWGTNLVALEAVGRSMIPTIMPGEFMVCYPSDWWDDGMVVIVNVNDSDTVKRIYHAKDGGIDLVPDNPSYKFQHFSPQEIEDYHVSVLAHVLTKLPRDIKPIPRRKEE